MRSPVGDLLIGINFTTFSSGRPKQSPSPRYTLTLSSGLELNSRPIDESRKLVYDMIYTARTRHLHDNHNDNEKEEDDHNHDSKAHSSYNPHASNSLSKSFGLQTDQSSNNLILSISNARMTSNSDVSPSKSTKVSYFDRYPERKNQGPYVLDSKLTTTPTSSRRREREKDKGKEKERDRGKEVGKAREVDKHGETHKESSQMSSVNPETTNSNHGEEREGKALMKAKEKDREKAKANAKDRSIGRSEAKETASSLGSTSSLGHGLGISSFNLSTFSASPSSTSTGSVSSSSPSSRGEDRLRTDSIIKHREQAHAAAFKSPSGYPSAPSSLTKRHSRKDLKLNGSPSSNSEGGHAGFSSSSETPPTISEEKFNSVTRKTPKSKSRSATSPTSIQSPPAQTVKDAALYAALKKDLGISSSHEPMLRTVASSSSPRKLKSDAFSVSKTSTGIADDSPHPIEQPRKQVKNPSSRGKGMSEVNSPSAASRADDMREGIQMSSSGSNFLSSLSRSYSSFNTLTPLPDASPHLPFPRSPSAASPDSSPSRSGFSLQSSSTPINRTEFRQSGERASPSRVRPDEEHLKADNSNSDLNSNRAATKTMIRLEAPKTSSKSRSSSSPRLDDRRLSTYSGYSLSSTGTASSYAEPLSPNPFLVQVDTSWWEEESQDQHGLRVKSSQSDYQDSTQGPSFLAAPDFKPTPATYAASSAAMGKSRSSHSNSASSKLKTEYVPSIEDILRSHSKLPGTIQPQSQRVDVSRPRPGASSPRDFDSYPSSVKSIPCSPSSRESSIYEGLLGTSSSSSKSAAQSLKSHRKYQLNSSGIASASGVSEGKLSWSSRSTKARHGSIPEYAEVRSQSQPRSMEDLEEPSEDSDDESISSVDSIEREIRQSLKNERRKTKLVLIDQRPPIGSRSFSASLDTNPTSLSGDIDADSSGDCTGPPAAKKSPKALHHATSFPNRKILSKGSRSPPSPLELNGLSSFNTPPLAPQARTPSVPLGKGKAASGKANSSAPYVRRRAVSTASTNSSAAAVATSPALPSLEDGSNVAHYLRSSKLTKLLKLARNPNEGLTVSVADVGAPSGHPVVVFLGLGAVRYLVALYEEMSAALDLRLICIDRWGLGRTTDVLPEKRGVLDWAPIVDEVTSQLGIERFSVLAHSAGAPYAMATVLLYPHKIAGPAHLLAPWVNSTHESGYKWLKYVPDTVIKTAQAAEWKMQGWKLGKNPNFGYDGVGSDGVRTKEVLGTPNSDSLSSTSIDVENHNGLEVLSSPAMTSCSSDGPSPTSSSHRSSSNLISNQGAFSPQMSVVETPTANRSAKTLRGKPSFLGGIFTAKHSGHSHSSSNPSARPHMNHSSSQTSLASSPLGQDSDSTSQSFKSDGLPIKESAPVGLIGRAASIEIPRPSLAEDLVLTSALFRLNGLDQGKASSSVDGHTLSGSHSFSHEPSLTKNGTDFESAPIRRSFSSSTGGLPRMPLDSSKCTVGMLGRSASTNSIDASNSASIDVSNSSLGENVFFTPQMKQGGWIKDSSSSPRPSPKGPSIVNLSSSSSKKPMSGDPGASSQTSTPFSQSSKTFTSSQSPGLNSSTPTSANASADLTTALLRASHAESLKGGTADLMTILGRGAKPWGFSFSDIQHPVKVWHGDKDEKISLTGVTWMEREMERCQVKIVKGAGHGLMTNVGVFVEALER